MKAKLVLIAAIVFVASGCATSRVYQSSTALAPPLESSVLILPADVEVSLQNAGGGHEPRADWTETARNGLTAALEDFFINRGIRPVRYEGQTITDEDLDVIRQANINLDAIELAQTRGGVEGSRKYALTPELVDNLDEYDADYAVFVMLRSAHASGGRVAVAILAAVGGVSVPMGSASYRVALFDLRDGQVAWANFNSYALGQLGNPAKADNARWQKSFNSLFDEFPL